jgi:hypothetical protein
MAHVVNRPWSKPEREALRRLFPTTPTMEIADLLGRSFSATKTAARKLGLQKAGTGYRRWTAEEVAAVRRLYPTTPTAEVAARLGRTVTATKHIAIQQGIRKVGSVPRDSITLDPAPSKGGSIGMR